MAFPISLHITETPPYKCKVVPPNNSKNGGNLGLVLFIKVLFFHKMKMSMMHDTRGYDIPGGL